MFALSIPYLLKPQKTAAASNFMGWPVWQVFMPDAGRIVCTYCVDGKEP